MFNKLKSTVGDLASKAGDLKNMGVEALQATVKEFNEARPLFIQVGYRVGKVDVVIGITPRVNFVLERVASVEDSVYDELLAAHKGNKVFATILTALRQASLLQSRI